MTESSTINVNNSYVLIIQRSADFLINKPVTKHKSVSHSVRIYRRQAYDNNGHLLAEQNAEHVPLSSCFVVYSLFSIRGRPSVADGIPRDTPPTTLRLFNRHKQ